MMNVTRILSVSVTLFLMTACGGIVKSGAGVSLAVDVANLKLAHNEIPIAKTALFTADLSEHEMKLVADAVSYAEMLVERYKSPEAVELIMARSHLNELAHKYHVVYVIATRHWDGLSRDNQTALLLYDESARKAYVALSDRLDTLQQDGLASLGLSESESMMSLVLTTLRLVGRL